MEGKIQGSLKVSCWRHYRLLHGSNGFVNNVQNSLYNAHRVEYPRVQAFLLVPWRNTSSFIILFAWIITTNKNNAVRRDRTRPYCDQLSFEIYNEIHFNFFHAFLLSSSRRSAVALRACYGFDFEPIRAFTCFTAINTMSWDSFLVKYCTIWIFHIGGWYFQTWCNFINIDTPPHHLVNFVSVKWGVTIFFF